jgi:hypothetical protein
MNSEQDDEAARADLLAKKSRLIDFHHPTFVRLMCEALLGIKHDGDTNPFLTDDDKSGTDGGIWGDLARAALARLDLEPTRGASVAPDETGEFIALKDWIARRFHPRRVHLLVFMAFRPSKSHSAFAL